jgi:hypothetical protein
MAGEIMKKNIFLIIILFSLFNMSSSFASSEIQDKIKSYAINLSSENWLETFSSFHKYPKISTSILIDQLKVCKRGKYRKDDPQKENVPQVVWHLRAIHSLVGIRFKFKSEQKLDEQEATFLNYGSDGKINFYGTWMSRDITWTAPEDVQQKIIKSWQDWKQKELDRHLFSPKIAIDNWYFE